MQYNVMLRLQKCLFFNVCTFVIWVLVTGFFLYAKFSALDHLTKYLSVAVFTLLVMIESARLYLGHYGNLSKRCMLQQLSRFCLFGLEKKEKKLIFLNFMVPELAGFLMLTVLMQLPLVSFFLFNPSLLSTSTEVTLHAMLWLISVSEIFLGYFSLKEASVFAKSVYLSHAKSN